MRGRDRRRCVADLPGYRLTEGAMFNRKSAIGNQKLVHPPAVVRNEDRQFFHHELRLPDGSDHACPSGGVPFLGHFLAGVAAPALNVGVAGENPAIDFGQVVIVQPGFTRALDVVAVIEHETGAVRVPEIFKPVTFS